MYPHRKECPYIRIMFIGVLCIGFVFNMVSNAISEKPIEKLVPGKSVSYYVTLYTDHKDTDGLSFIQTRYVYGSPTDGLAYRTVVKDFHINKLILVPNPTGGVILVPSSTIKGFKITLHPKSVPMKNTTELTDYSREIPPEPIIRLDKLGDSGIIQ